MNPTSTPAKPRMAIPRDRWFLVAIVTGAILVRVAVMFTGLGRLDDPDGYLRLARSIAEGRGFSINGHPTAYRPPLYPAAPASRPPGA